MAQYPRGVLSTVTAWVDNGVYRVTPVIHHVIPAMMNLNVPLHPIVTAIGSIISRDLRR